jgi:hypothetical protein
MEIISEKAASSSGSEMITDHIFPLKPQSAKLELPVKVLTNFYKFE